MANEQGKYSVRVESSPLPPAFFQPWFIVKTFSFHFLANGKMFRLENYNYIIFLIRFCLIYCNITARKSLVNSSKLCRCHILVYNYFCANYPANWHFRNSRQHNMLIIMAVLYKFETASFYFIYKIEKDVVRQESKIYLGLWPLPPSS